MTCPVFPDHGYLETAPTVCCICLSRGGWCNGLRREGPRTAAPIVPPPKTACRPADPRDGAPRPYTTCRRRAGTPTNFRGDFLHHLDFMIALNNQLLQPSILHLELPQGRTSFASKLPNHLRKCRSSARSRHAASPPKIPARDSPPG
jgi:hypothetical protein